MIIKNIYFVSRIKKINLKKCLERKLKPAKILYYGRIEMPIIVLFHVHNDTHIHILNSKWKFFGHQFLAISDTIFCTFLTNCLFGCVNLRFYGCLNGKKTRWKRVFHDFFLWCFLCVAPRDFVCSLMCVWSCYVRLRWMKSTKCFFGVVNN